jgi:hypothetical protein
MANIAAPFVMPDSLVETGCSHATITIKISEFTAVMADVETDNGKPRTGAYS